MLTNDQIASSNKWMKEADELWTQTLEGKKTITMPDKFCVVPNEGGAFIMLSYPIMELDEKGEILSPRIEISTYLDRTALKVFVPAWIKTGDAVRLVRLSKSGKSYIGAIQ